MDGGSVAIGSNDIVRRERERGGSKEHALCWTVVVLNFH